MEPKIINDPIWGPIELHPLCIKIIDTPQFQRLRHIKQLGGCSFVYPGACHNRFEHSIGTAHLARMIGEALKKKHEDKITKDDILCLEVAGLCHDLGHGPFSHVFDQQFQTKCKDIKTWTHEDLSQKMLKEIFDTLVRRGVIKEEQERKIIFDKLEFIQELIKPQNGMQKEKPYLYEIISNEVNKIDVDKWDYFSRDCHMLGLHHNFQCKRSIKLARIVDNHISFPKSEYFNLFDMFYTRFSLHRKAYQHPVVKAVEMMIADAFSKADNCLMFPSEKPDEKNDDEPKKNPDEEPDKKPDEEPKKNPDEEPDEEHDGTSGDEPKKKPDEEPDEEPKKNPDEEPDEERKKKPDVEPDGNWKTLSKSTECMNAYLWVTDDVLQQIRRIRDPKNERLKDAQNIIERIYCRDLYKSIEEKRVVSSEYYKLAPSGSCGEEITNKLIEAGFQSSLFEIEEAVFHYGNKNEDPMSDVNFYLKKKYKKEMDRSKLYELVNGNELKANLEVSDMLPKKFQQIYIRLYWKGIKSEDIKKQEIRDSFSGIKDVQVKDKEKDKEKKITVKLVDVKSYKD